MTLQEYQAALGHARDGMARESGRKLAQAKAAAVQIHAGNVQAAASASQLYTAHRYCHGGAHGLQAALELVQLVDILHVDLVTGAKLEQAPPGGPGTSGHPTTVGLLPRG